MNEKKCSRCGLIKILDNFYKNKNHRDGLSSYCKECNALYVHERYEITKEEHKHTVRKRANRVKEELRVKMMEYLSVHPCVDCGEGDPIVLEFDHVHGEKLIIYPN
jgi:hypothetical protein